MFDWFVRDNCGKFDREPFVNVKELIPGLKKVRKPRKDWDHDFSKMDSPYVNHFGVTDEKLMNVRSSVLVDLGAGNQAGGYKLAIRAGAGAYVGVERSNSDYLALRLSDYLSESIEQVPVAVVHADMLDFLRAVPDASVSILTSGIDNNILSSKRYREKVRNEIQRVVGDYGIHLSYCSPGITVF